MAAEWTHSCNILLTHSPDIQTNFMTKKNSDKLGFLPLIEFEEVSESMKLFSGEHFIFLYLGLYLAK